MRNCSLHILIILGFIFSFGTKVSAQLDVETKNKQTIVIDGQKYSKEDVIGNFLRVAFSDIPWNADAGEEDRKKLYEMYFPPKPSIWDQIQRAFSGKPIPNSKSRGPIWLREKHVHYVGKGPLYKRNIITKWSDNEITIGIDWPRFVDPSFAKDASSNIQERHNKYGNKYYDLLIDQVRLQIADLSDAIGRPVKLIEPNDKRDATEKYARIRIIPHANWSGRSWEQPHHDKRPITYEESLLNGVLFQSYTRTHFDGYLLPDKSQALDLVICKVDRNLDQRFLRPLINECLVRGLGLPAMSDNSSSLLSHWHTTHAPDFYTSTKWINPFRISAVPVKDKMIYRSPEWLEKQWLKKSADRLRKDMTWFDLSESQLASFSKITPYDKLMLSLLYCPEIKSGMNKEEVRNLLRTDESCFQ